MGPQNIHPHPPPPEKCLMARNGGGGGGVYKFALEVHRGAAKSSATNAENRAILVHSVSHIALSKDQGCFLFSEPHRGAKAALWFECRLSSSGAMPCRLVQCSAVTTDAISQEKFLNCPEWALFRNTQPVQLAWKVLAVHLQFVPQYPPPQFVTLRLAGF